MTRPSDDEALLAPWFAEARADEAGADEAAPSTALLSAILADAADVAAARTPAPAAPAPAARAGWWRPALLAPIGGWGGLATLGACAATGFWLGTAGNLALDGTSLTTASTVTADADAQGVDAFFDYASLEQ